MKPATLFLLGLGTGVAITAVTAYAMSGSEPEKIEDTPVYREKSLEKLFLKMYGAEKALLVSKMSEEEIENIYNFFFKTIGIKSLMEKAGKGKKEPPKLVVAETSGPLQNTVQRSGEETEEEKRRKAQGKPAVVESNEPALLPDPDKKIISGQNLQRLLEINEKYKIFKR